MAFDDEGAYGDFRSADARRAGWTDRQIAIAVKDGTWHPVGRGAFVERARWLELDPRGRHLATVHARLRAKRRDWVAARRSAVLAHGLPMIGDPPAMPQLLRDRAGTSSEGHSRHERVAVLHDDERTTVNGVDATALDRTAVDVARSEVFRNAVVVADAALRRGISKDQLLDMARRCAGWPGGLAGMRAVEFADGLSESALESISRVGCHLLELPPPELQIKVVYAGQVVARVDTLWRQFNTIGQADGALKYKEKGAERVLADKEQDEKLEDLGFEVARWGWTEAWKPRGILDARLRRAFARGARQTIDPGVTLVQATVEECLAVQHSRAA